jgi:hypothetical protein
MCVQEVIAGNRGFLQSEPVLPRARIRAAQGQAEAMIHQAQRLGSVAECDNGRLLFSRQLKLS